MGVPSTTDLIVAPATPPRPAARAIVRLTGEGLVELLGRLFTANHRTPVTVGGKSQPGPFSTRAASENAGCKSPQPAAADAFYAPLTLPAVGEPPRQIPVRLHPDSLGRDWGELPVTVLFWPGPAGPLGAAAAEVQLPGSPLLQAAVVEEACRLGARLARGGEFSLRSFLAGKIDLLQAEAVVAVVDARTPEELSTALDRMAGGVGRAVEHLRGRLLDLVADIEAAIDFADDFTPDAVPVAETAAGALLPQLEPILIELDAVAAQLLSREAAVTGGLPRVVLAGPPNIGKSSLFNALLGREAALVEDAAGTTRDWIGSELLDPSGTPACLLVDLAGVLASPEQASDEPDELVASVVAAADRVAREEIGRAHVVVVCRDVATQAGPAIELPPAMPRIDVLTRSDRLTETPVSAPPCLITSTATGAGVEPLRQNILSAVAALPQQSPATLRLRAGITAARQPLESARQLLAGTVDGLPPDEALLAVLLRQAIDALGEVTGAVIGSDIIDRVFSRHCIGK